jgi:hypothetical protein
MPDMISVLVSAHTAQHRRPNAAGAFVPSLLQWSLRLLWPPTGRRRASDGATHRATPPPPSTTPRPPMTSASASRPAGAGSLRTPRAPGPLLRGEDHRLVRPYVTAAEQRREDQDRRLTHAVRALAQNS